MYISTVQNQMHVQSSVTINHLLRWTPKEFQLIQTYLRRLPFPLYRANSVRFFMNFVKLYIIAFQFLHILVVSAEADPAMWEMGVDFHKYFIKLEFLVKIPPFPSESVTAITHLGICNFFLLLTFNIITGTLGLYSIKY